MLQHAQRVSSNVSQTCRFFGVSRALFYIWKERYERHGVAGLRDQSRRPHHIRLRISLSRFVSIFPLPSRKSRPITTLRSVHSSPGIFPISASLIATYLPDAPEVNGKVERSHKTDSQEFYQGRHFRHKRDLARKLKRWETEYNEDRPHLALKGKPPAERLRELNRPSRPAKDLS